MVKKTGQRVGAVLSAHEDTVKFLGYGIYNGDHPPKEAVGFMAETLYEGGVPNPQIKLDSGKVVYGCECWWGSEEKIKSQLEKYDKIIEVDIDDIREKQRHEK